MSDTNPALVEALATLEQQMPNPITHGEFNRRLFLETMFITGGLGVSVERDLILSTSGMTVKEFEKIKDEYIAQGIIEEKKNFCGMLMYSLKYEV